MCQIGCRRRGDRTSGLMFGRVDRQFGGLPAGSPPFPPRDRSVPAYGVSRGPRAYRVRVPISGSVYFGNRSNSVARCLLRRRVARLVVLADHTTAEAFTDAESR